MERKHCISNGMAYTASGQTGCIRSRVRAVALPALLALLVIASPAGAQTVQNKTPRTDKPPRQAGAPAPAAAERYTIAQSVSEKAQLNTIAFSGLAFLTGNFGADTFLPPGKAADYFGFQYMRDIDIREGGHNMMFLTNIANNILAILDTDQIQLFMDLASEQDGEYRELAERRLVLIRAFRDNMEGKAPAGTTGLSLEGVQDWTAGIFDIDGRLSFRRAEVYGRVVSSLSDSQKANIARLIYGDSASWPELPNQQALRRLPHEQGVLVMTYASEFFSWYAGSETGDVYFCPERHATYFGGFYMKDYPAMGNRDYFIPTALTGDSGDAFINLLGSEASLVTELYKPVQAMLTEILSIRTAISREFRKYLTGGSADEYLVMKLSHRYGELDGRISFMMAESFKAVSQSLDPERQAALTILRNQEVLPKGYYLYSNPVDKEAVIDSQALASLFQ